jgi:pilus assembly protein CpaB
MTKRIVGFVAAVVLALVGTMALVAYVNSATERALAGEQLVEIYVVTAPIPGGTPAEAIEDYLEVEQVPVKVRATGAVDSIPALTGLVTAVDLVPGEQLLTERFIERTMLDDRQVGIEVPEEMVEVSIQLEPERAIGGLLEPGQTVAVFASFGPSDLGQTAVDVEGEIVPVPAAADPVEGSTSNTTDLLFHKVLVTAVQEPSGRPPEQSEQRLTTSPGGTILVTLALHTYDAERLVFTAEYGSIWLGIERETVPDLDEPGQTRGSVLLDWAGAR